MVTINQLPCPHGAAGDRQTKNTTRKDAHMSRNRKYKMTAISSKFSEKGGYRAQFLADGTVLTRSISFRECADSG